MRQPACMYDEKHHLAKGFNNSEDVNMTECVRLVKVEKDAHLAGELRKYFDKRIKMKGDNTGN